MALKAPDVGKMRMLTDIFAGNKTLHLFTNNHIPASADTAASYTEATFTGYAASTIAGGSWTVTNPSSGVAQAANAQVTFASSANQTAQTVYGYYVLHADGATLAFAELFASAQTIQNNGDTIKITPQFQMTEM